MEGERDQEVKEAGKKESSEAVTRVRDSSHGISHNTSRSLRCTGCSGTDRVSPVPRVHCSRYARSSACPLLSTLMSRSRSSVLHVVVSGCIASSSPDLSRPPLATANYANYCVTLIRRDEVRLSMYSVFVIKRIPHHA